MIFPTTTLVSSHTLDQSYSTGPPWRFDDWSFGSVVRILCWWCLLHQKKWPIWIWIFTLTVWQSLASVTSVTFINCSVTWFLRCTLKSMSHRQWWLYKVSLFLFEDTQLCRYPGIRRSWLTLVVLAPFLCSMSKTSVIILQTLPSFLSTWTANLDRDHLDCQLMIITHHLHYQLDVDSNPAWWRPSILKSSFNCSRRFLNFLYHSKISSRQMLLSIHLVKQLK